MNGFLWFHLDFHHDLSSLVCAVCQLQGELELANDRLRSSEIEHNSLVEVRAKWLDTQTRYDMLVREARSKDHNTSAIITTHTERYDYR